MFTGVEYCWRMPPTDRAVEPLAQVVSRSTITTRPSKPGSDTRKYPTALPITPPPIITTSYIAHDPDEPTCHHPSRTGQNRQPGNACVERTHQALRGQFYGLVQTHIKMPRGPRLTDSRKPGIPAVPTQQPKNPSVSHMINKDKGFNWTQQFLYCPGRLAGYGDKRCSE